MESSNNYNVIFGGDEKPLTKMTIKEIYELQSDMKKEGKGSTAVGRYQFINRTLKDAVRDVGVDENAVFDEKLQDRLARSRLQFRGIEDYKAGRISREDFIENLSQEWAAVPKDASNESYHADVMNNKALTDFESMKNLFKE